MRFEGTQLIHAPVKFVWRALREPGILERSIPHCTRIETQPGYRSDHEGDMIMGFEVGAPNPQTGAEPIVGWIEAAPFVLGGGLSLHLTLDDGTAQVSTHGMIRLIGRDYDQQTEIRYAMEAGVVDTQSSGWSAEAIAAAERQISSFLATFTDLVEEPELTLPGGSLATNTSAAVGAAGVQVLVETKRGQILLVPSHPVPSPTQGMLRRLRAVERAHVRQIIVAWAVAGTAAVASGVAIWRAISKLTTRPRHTTLPGR